MHRLLLLSLSTLLPITAFWSTPSCQPSCYPCRCERYYSCGSSSPGGTGYAMPRVGGGWGEDNLSPASPSNKPRKFVFIWSDEEEETDERMKSVSEGRIRPEERNEMLIPPTIKRTKPQKPQKEEEILDAASLLEIDSAEIEKGRIKSTKSSKDEEDLWTDSERPSKGTLPSLPSKGDDDLWKGQETKSADWRNSASSSVSSGSVDQTMTPVNTGAMGGQPNGGYRGLGTGGGGGSGLGLGGGRGFGGGGGSLFGISSGFGVTAPGVGPIGGGWGFGVGK